MRALPPISFLAHRTAPTRVARYFFWCYLLVVLLVSFYPFSGWRFTGEPIFAFYTYPLPYYFTFFDNLINVVAYFPLGLSAALAMRRWRWLGPLLAALIGILTSCGVEFVQQFIPTRVASNMDILSNGCGSVIGAFVSVIVAMRRSQRRWLVFRHSHLFPGGAAEWGMVWLGLWLITQFDPSVPFFGVVDEPRGIPQPILAPMGDPALFLNLLEGCGMMLNTLGVCLFVSVLVRHSREIPRAIALLVTVVLASKIVFAGAMLKWVDFFAWINHNVALGGLAALPLLAVLLRLKRPWRALAGAVCLLATVLVSWMWPLTPQLSAILPLFRWNYGHLMHFRGLAALISDLWPYGTMLFLLGFAATYRSENEPDW
ncbi:MULTISPECIES: VanZ family protein [Silvimonas]|uniref:VanZ family protein n=1 Tax=Silvimonas TaxID=300264 RepID=UPI0024B34B5A|nr:MULTISPECIES: VanZ family protein [Silvimonas]MDR3425974.1 VanZ family protein [Silvimonas sp.]